MAVVIEMPYIGGCLSVNAMKIVRWGRRTHHNKPEVQDWIDDLAEKTWRVKGGLVLPIKVRLSAKFRDERHPDLDNLFKAVCDGVKAGLGIDDKHFLPIAEGWEVGHSTQKLIITLEGSNG